MDSTIYIRTDGNTHIATGHLMRCLSIARALQKYAAKSQTLTIQFLVSDSESRQLLEHFFEIPCEFPVTILKTASYLHPEQELEELLLLGASSRPLLLIDSYFVTSCYLQQLKTGFTTIYLDDLRLFDYPVDVVINYDLLTASSRRDYEHFYRSAGKKLLGGAYAPLRPQFWEASGSSRKDDHHHILIASGGSDPYHTTLHLVSHLLASFSEGYCFDVLVGALNPDREALQVLSENPSVLLHEGVSKMAALMASCDLAISAAGTTLYELCAIGIPTASFILADNQCASARSFEECGMIPCLGDVREHEADVLKKATAWVASNPPSIRSLSKENPIDGTGALRIARELLSLPYFSSGSLMDIADKNR